MLQGTPTDKNVLCRGSYSKLRTCYLSLITFDHCLWWRIFICNKVQFLLACVRVITIAQINVR